MQLTASDKNRFRKFATVSLNGCWNWSGFRNKSGHPRFMLSGYVWQAHRLVYQWCVDDREAYLQGLDIHHICENPACVNPSHLTAITRKQHVGVTRGQKFREYRAKDHCVRGHFFTEENTYLRLVSNGYQARVCRECQRMQAKKYRDKKLTIAS